MVRVGRGVGGGGLGVALGGRLRDVYAALGEAFEGQLQDLEARLSARMDELERRLAYAGGRADELIDVPELARLMGMSEPAVRAACRRRTLPVTAIRQGRRLRFRRGDVQQWQAGCQAEARAVTARLRPQRPQP